MNRSAVAPRVTAFFVEQFRREVKPDTTINFDLGIDGLDVDELLGEFAAEFDVDMTGFEYDRYFAREACCDPRDLVLLAKAWLSGRFWNRFGLEPLTVGDLIAAANAGQWTHRFTAYTVNPK